MLLKFRIFCSLSLTSLSICPDFSTKKKLGLHKTPTYLLGQTPQSLLFIFYGVPKLKLDEKLDKIAS